MAHSVCTTILLVEDQALIAMAESTQLEKKGYRVLTAYTGEEAIRLAESNDDIDLVLMDIDLGKSRIDGTEAARRILARNELPVVFLSSHTEPEMVERTEEITSYGYIVKNSGFTVLETSIKMAFRLFQAHQEVKKHKEETQQVNTLLAESREDLKATLHSIGDAVFSTDLSGTMARMNPVAEKITGWTMEEARGRHYKDVFRIINAHTRKEAEDPIHKALHDGTVAELANHTILVSKEGLEYQIADSASPIRDAKGAVRGAVVVFRDVTEAYNIREDLSRSEDRLSKVMAEGIKGDPQI
ncbi:MAG: response regulator [Spirochaetales bacterium]|nr:response regulator [Spirochaetales bacterium]